MADGAWYNARMKLKNPFLMVEYGWIVYDRLFAEYLRRDL
jgi:hypothetical protein